MGQHDRAWYSRFRSRPSDDSKEALEVFELIEQTLSILV